MVAGHKFHVEIDESRAPTYFVVTVAEPECRTMHWQFFERRHAEMKAKAERQRLEAQFCVAA
jgi:uncharacterized membrane protein